jgi:hypothetical protein
MVRIVLLMFVWTLIVWFSQWVGAKRFEERSKVPTDHAVKIGHAIYNPTTGEKEWVLFGTPEQYNKQQQ